MTKEQKVNWIKCWLQTFGERDYTGFKSEVVVDKTTWNLWLQYNYHFRGDEIAPQNWCCWGFKHVHDNDISDRSDEELDGIINQLKLIKI